MICKWCNKEIPENCQFCPTCGKNINDVNNEGQNVFNFADNLGNVNNMNNDSGSSNVNLENVSSVIESKEEKVNVWLVILSWFIPLAGLIIFLVKKDNEPKTAKVSGICALISVIVNILIIIVVFSFVFSATNKIIDKIPFEEQQVVEDSVDANNDVINSDNDEVTNATTDWKSYEVSINNTTLSLPTTYSQLSKLTNFTYKSSDLKSYLDSGYYTLLNMYNNDKLALYVEVLNDTSEDLLYTDCKITRISQSKYQVSQGAVTIVFPGGLKAGDSITEAEITSLFGTPSDVDSYSSDGYESKTYKYSEDTFFTTTNNFHISVVNGVIDELQLDNRNY